MKELQKKGKEKENEVLALPNKHLVTHLPMTILVEAPSSVSNGPIMGTAATPVQAFSLGTCPFKLTGDLRSQPLLTDISPQPASIIASRLFLLSNRKRKARPNSSDYENREIGRPRVNKENYQTQIFIHFSSPDEILPKSLNSKHITKYHSYFLYLGLFSF